MNVNRALDIGAETPYMAVDMNQTRSNIKKMQKIADTNGKKLRPHSKTHKIPRFTRMEMDYGARGICVQKVSEAEVMYYGGAGDILISNEVVDSRKCNRIADLSAMGCDISVAVDSVTGAENLSRSAEFRSVNIPVLIDVNIGMNRCGVDPDQVREFYNRLSRMKGIEIAGFMAYDGQVKHNIHEERMREVKKGEAIVSRFLDSVKDLTRGNETVSVGGTPTSYIWAESDLVNELQPGTYVYYDMRCESEGLCSVGEISMGVVSQVISKSVGRIVLDAGSKAVSMDQHVFPKALARDGKIAGEIISMSEEHTVIRTNNKSPEIGETVLLLPYHSCTTTDLWDYTWVYEKGRNPVLTKIEGRGKRE